MSALFEESQLAACSIVPGQNSKQSEVDISPKLFRGLSTVGNFAVATLNYFLISSGIAYLWNSSLIKVGFTDVAVLPSMSSLYGYGLATGGCYENEQLPLPCFDLSIYNVSLQAQ